MIVSAPNGFAVLPGAKVAPSLMVTAGGSIVPVPDSMPPEFTVTPDVPLIEPSTSSVAPVIVVAPVTARAGQHFLAAGDGETAAEAAVEDGAGVGPVAIGDGERVGAEIDDAGAGARKTGDRAATTAQAGYSKMPLLMTAFEAAMLPLPLMSSSPPALIVVRPV